MLVSGVIMQMISEGRQQQQEEELTRIGNMISNEILLARSVEDNYRRFFSIPETLDGSEYQIRINLYDPPYSNNSEVIISSDDLSEEAYESKLFIRHVNITSLDPGCNMIMKSGSSIRVESSDPENC